MFGSIAYVIVDGNKYDDYLGKKEKLERMKNRMLWLGVGVGFLVLTLIALLVWDTIRRKADVETKPKYLAIEETDPEMKEAIVKARSTVNEYIDRLTKPKASYSYFAIKARFEENKNVEHLWLNFVTYNGKEFSGSVANTPREIKSVTFGKEVHVKPDSISDWMVIDNGVLVGGYTLRVLRKRMSEIEKKQFDYEGGFKVVDTVR